MPKREKKKKAKKAKKEKGSWRADEAVAIAAQRHLHKIGRASRRMVGDEPDREAVHDFRVGIRRLRTVLRAARDVYGKKKIKITIAKLKQFGDATNALRDEEVLSDTLAPLLLSDDTADEVESWLSRRAIRERQLRSQANRFLRGPELPRCIHHVEKLLQRGPVKKQALEAFAQEQLARVQHAVLELVDVKEDDTEGLHTLRIRFKRLRYTAEMLDDFTARTQSGLKKQSQSSLTDGPRLGTIAQRAARLQESLGLLHDADVALDTINRARSIHKDHSAALKLALLQHRQKLVTNAVNELQNLPRDTLGAPSG